jgi:hypothetical protein
MNFLDIILIILIIVCVVGGIALLILGCTADDAGGGIRLFIVAIFIAGLLVLPFVHIDKSSGSTIGTITSVDKNFFGTTAIYIKTSETSQEKYCIENSDIVEQAKELIGEKVKVSYGERIGLYSTGKCSSAPIDKIEELEKSDSDE